VSATRPGGSGRRRVTVTLEPSHAQAGKAIGFERALPGEELLLRELVATAGFLESYLAGPHCGYDRGFAADHPPLGVRRRQLNVHWFPGERVTTAPKGEYK
jgi:hypothetical protein